RGGGSTASEESAMWRYPGAQNKFTAIVSVRAHVDASRICLRSDGAQSECGRGLVGIPKAGPIHSRGPSTKKHRLFWRRLFLFRSTGSLLFGVAAPVLPKNRDVM